MWLLASASVAAVIVVVLVYSSQFGSELSTEHSNWGEFGDYVGGVLGPVFSFLALVVLIYTLTIQTRQFGLQNFERGFFELVRFHHDIVSDLEVKAPPDASPDRNVQGRDCFGVFNHSCLFTRLQKHYNAAKGVGRQVLERHEVRECVQSAYSEFRNAYGSEVDHYFRHLYHILKFVDESDVDEKHKYKCTRLLRAQLSADELLLLFYSSLHPVGDKSLKYLAKYAMLHNLDRDTLNNRELEEPLHDPAVFGYQRSTP